MWLRSVGSGVAEFRRNPDIWEFVEDREKVICPEHESSSAGDQAGVDPQTLHTTVFGSRPPTPLPVALGEVRVRRSKFKVLGEARVTTVVNPVEPRCGRCRFTSAFQASTQRLASARIADLLDRRACGVTAWVTEPVERSWEVGPRPAVHIAISMRCRTCHRGALGLSSHGWQDGVPTGVPMKGVRLRTEEVGTGVLVYIPETWGLRRWMIGCSTIAFTPTPMGQVLLLGSHALAGVIPGRSRRPLSSCCRCLSALGVTTTDAAAASLAPSATAGADG